jgi:hypothetical protein
MKQLNMEQQSDDKITTITGQDGYNKNEAEMKSNIHMMQQQPTCIIHVPSTQIIQPLTPNNKRVVLQQTNTPTTNSIDTTTNVNHDCSTTLIRNENVDILAWKHTATCDTTTTCIAPTLGTPMHKGTSLSSSPYLHGDASTKDILATPVMNTSQIANSQYSGCTQKMIMMTPSSTSSPIPTAVIPPPCDPSNNTTQLTKYQPIMPMVDDFAPRIPYFTISDISIRDDEDDDTNENNHSKVVDDDDQYDCDDDDDEAKTNILIHQMSMMDIHNNMSSHNAARSKRKRRQQHSPSNYRYRIPPCFSPSIVTIHRNIGTNTILLSPVPFRTYHPTRNRDHNRNILSDVNASNEFHHLRVEEEEGKNGTFINELTVNIPSLPIIPSPIVVSETTTTTSEGINIPIPSVAEVDNSITNTSTVQQVQQQTSIDTNDNDPFYIHHRDIITTTFLPSTTAMIASSLRMRRCLEPTSPCLADHRNHHHRYISNSNFCNRDIQQQ